MALTLGSLFDGMAGFPLAFARAGVATRWVVELDDDCRKVSGNHFPEAAAFVDVRDVGAHNLAPVDIITGGFPCQDLSVSGARAGLAGDRSGLFFEIVRIVREMREATANEYPKYLVLENVPGLLSSNGGRDFAVVLGELAGLGAVDIGWRVCDAQYWGVAQRRRRVFLVASFRTGASAAEVLFEREGSLGHPPSRREARQGTARVAATRAAFGGNNTSGPIPVACGLNAKGGSGRMDFETETFVTERLPPVTHSLTVRHGVTEDGTGRGTPLVCDWPAEVAPTLGTGWADRAPGSQNQDWLAQKGGLFVPVAFDMQQVTSVANRQRIEPGRPAPTLHQQGGAHIAFNANSYAVGAGNNLEGGRGVMAVRRLTPL